MLKRSTDNASFKQLLTLHRHFKPFTHETTHQRQLLSTGQMLNGRHVPPHKHLSHQKLTYQRLWGPFGLPVPPPSRWAVGVGLSVCTRHFRHESQPCPNVPRYVGTASQRGERLANHVHTLRTWAVLRVKTEAAWTAITLALQKSNNHIYWNSLKSSRGLQEQFQFCGLLCPRSILEEWIGSYPDLSQIIPTFAEIYSFLAVSECMRSYSRWKSYSLSLCIMQKKKESKSLALGMWP